MASGAPPIRCPSCGSDGPFSKPNYVGERGRGVGVFLVGGLWAWLLHSTGREEEWQCVECSAIFRRPGGVSRRLPWLVAVLPFALIPILVLIVFIMWSVDDDRFVSLISNEDSIKWITTITALGACALIVVIRALKSRGGD